MFSLPNGRVHMKRIDETQIAKPYSPNERLCYKVAYSTGSALTKYIANYYGSCPLDVVDCCGNDIQELRQLCRDSDEDNSKQELWGKSGVDGAYPSTPYLMSLG